MNNRIRWGIVSTGRITHTFAQDLATLTDGTLQAVYARRPEAAGDFTSRYGARRAYSHYDDLLADPEVDAVYIATPHTVHHDQARDALRAGKAVLCEKPLVVNPAECRSLLATAGETGTYLMEGMWTWFLPAVRQALDWYRAGRIGALRHLQADFGYPQLPYDPERREYNADLGGGCLLEMGVYPVALDWLFRKTDPIGTHVQAHFAPNGVEDDLSWILDYGDSVSRLATSFRARLGNAAAIIGEEGWILIPDFFRASECILFELDTEVDRFREKRQGHGFEHQIAAVQADLRAGRRQSETVRLADSLAFQERMAALHDAIQTTPPPVAPGGSDPEPPA